MPTQSCMYGTVVLYGTGHDVIILMYGTSMICVLCCALHVQHSMRLLLLQCTCTACTFYRHVRDCVTYVRSAMYCTLYQTVNGVPCGFEARCRAVPQFSVYSTIVEHSVYHRTRNNYPTMITYRTCGWRGTALYKDDTFILL